MNICYELISEDDTTLVAMTDCGEGPDGDYDPDNPNDVALLRFDVRYKDADGYWEFANDASYCTGVPVDTDPARVQELLQTIMNEVHGKIDAHGGGIKKICERLSHLI